MKVSIVGGRHFKMMSLLHETFEGNLRIPNDLLRPVKHQRTISQFRKNG